MICIYYFLLITYWSPVDAEYSLDTKYAEVPIDHFAPTHNKTFKLRYLVNGQFHIKGGPVFVYTGNEADVSMFAQNTGFMFDIAPIFNALVVFIEHRYYGKSLPFGSSSLENKDNLRYLSTSQALSDFVYVIDELKKTYLKHMISNDTYPFIAFGGSYGGMLAAWLRMKYPNSVAGAISASAPIWYFDEDIPCGKFYEIITNVFEKFGSKNCTEFIKNSWLQIRNVAKTSKGKEDISVIWRTCNKFSTQSDVDKLISWLTDIYVNLAMTNYPYPTNFLVPLPAYPVKAFCDKLVSLKSNDSTIEDLGKALELYTNYTGKTKCNDVNKTTSDFGEKSWNYQVCTEMIMPICSTENDMFETKQWNLKKYTDECFKQFGVHSWRPDWPVLEYGGKNLRYFSNIVFSNGLMDPWSYAGVLHNVSSSIMAVNIIDGAHHVDLRMADPADTNYVVEARKFHVKAIRQFLNIT